MSITHDHDHDHDHGHGHGHGHDHFHEHSHDHGPTQIEAAPHGGPVLMDIGGDIGALIVRLDDNLEGTEIPIESIENPTLEKHTGIWRRSTGTTSMEVDLTGDGQLRPATAARSSRLASSR